MANRLPARLSVTLRYSDHIGWNSSKIISQLVNQWCSLFADPKIMDLFQGEHPKFWPEWRMEKVAFGVQKL